MWFMSWHNFLLHVYKSLTEIIWIIQIPLYVNTESIFSLYLFSDICLKRFYSNKSFANMQVKTLHT